MGDESKIKEFNRGNTRPLDRALKPSTADSIEEAAPEISRVPRSRDELPRTEEADRKTGG